MSRQSAQKIQREFNHKLQYIQDLLKDRNGGFGITDSDAKDAYNELDSLSESFNDLVQKSENFVDDLENIEFNAHAEGCGLEDANITDRYEAMEYGWNEALKEAVEVIAKQL